MGIFDFFSQLFKQSAKSVDSGEQERFIATALADSRKHSRFSVCYKNAAYLMTESGVRLDIANISFEGVGVYFERGEQDKLISSGKVRFHFLGIETDAFIQQAYLGAPIAGYRLVHAESGTLIFVGDIIDILKKGASLELLKKDILQHHLRNEEWIALRGEGPTDLRIKVDRNEQVVHCALTFRIGEDYYELLFDGITLQVRPTGRGAPMSDSVTRYALGILLGIQDPRVARLLGPVFGVGIKTL